MTNIDLACLKSTPPRLSVECKIAEPRVSGKPTIIVREKMFEVIANSDCIWSRSYIVSRSSREQCWKGTRDVALCVEIIDGCLTARRPWYCWGWLMRSSFLYRLLDGLLFCQSLCSTGDKSSCKVGIIRMYVLWRWQFLASCQSISHQL